MDEPKVGILALGNLLRKDEGVGQHLLERLRYILPAGVAMLDGGTSGLELLGFLEHKKYLLILDAVDAGGKAGDIVLWEGESVPRYTELKLSEHQMNFAEVLYWTHVVGAAPEKIAVIGIQPASLEWGLGLSETVKASVPLALEKIKACLQEWQIPLEQETYMGKAN